MKRIYFIIPLLFCCGPEEYCYLNRFMNYTEYDIKLSHTTQDGVLVDTHEIDGTQYVVDFDKLDNRFNCIDQCLQSLPNIQCYGKKISPSPIKRKCAIIKVVPPDGRTFDDLWQLIKIHKNQYNEIHDANPAECIEKGQEPSEEHPCRFRWTVQNGYVIITPPDLYIYALVEIHTGCREYWYIGELARCATKCH